MLFPVTMVKVSNENFVRISLDRRYCKYVYQIIVMKLLIKEDAGWDGRTNFAG